LDKILDKLGKHKESKKWKKWEEKARNLSEK